MTVEESEAVACFPCDLPAGIDGVWATRTQIGHGVLAASTAAHKGQ